MTTNGDAPGAAADGRGRPSSAVLPEPTYWPAVLAAALCFALWGVLTSPWLIVVGLGGSVLAIARWLADLQREPDDEPGDAPGPTPGPEPEEAER